MLIAVSLFELAAGQLPDCTLQPDWCAETCADCTEWMMYCTGSVIKTTFTDFCEESSVCAPCEECAAYVACPEDEPTPMPSSACEKGDMEIFYEDNDRTKNCFQECGAFSACYTGYGELPTVGCDAAPEVCSTCTSMYWWVPCISECSGWAYCYDDETKDDFCDMMAPEICGTTCLEMLQSDYTCLGSVLEQLDAPDLETCQDSLGCADDDDSTACYQAGSYCGCGCDCVEESAIALSELSGMCSSDTRRNYLCCDDFVTIPEAESVPV
jgi:hypothetical protein